MDIFIKYQFRTREDSIIPIAKPEIGIEEYQAVLGGLNFGIIGQSSRVKAFADIQRT